MPKNNKSSWFILGLVVIVIALVFAFKSKKPETDRIVKIGYLPIIASLPLYIAQENKYFENEEIQIEAISIQSSNQLVDALIRGDIDVIAEASAAPALSAEAIDPGKLKFFSLSDITQTNPFDSLLVKNNSQIKTLNDLKNKKIGVFPGSSATTFLRKFLQDRNVDTSQIQFVQIPPTTQLQALYAGSIDALHSYEPTTAIALNDNQVRKIHASVYADLINHNPQGAAIISQKFVSEYPELAKKVVDIFDKVFAEITANKEYIRKEIIPKYGQLEQVVADKVVFLYMSQSKYTDEDILQAYTDMLYDLGELKTKPDLSNIFYRE